MNPVYRSHVMTYGTYPDSWKGEAPVSGCDTRHSDGHHHGHQSHTDPPHTRTLQK